MENFAKKLAINQNVSSNSSKKTFPLKYINEDFEVIKRAYDLLSESVSKDVPIPPSGEWLLDNFYIIEEQVNSIRNSLSIKKYKKLPSVNNVARIYVLAREFVNYTDGAITKENIEIFINAYQTKRAISQSELYEFPMMLQIALIEHIRNVSSKIITKQLQKFKVESLVERIIENKDMQKQQFHKYKGVNLNNEAASYVEYLMYLLKRKGNDGKPYLDILEEEITKVGTTSSEIIKAEHYDMAVRRVSISNGIISLKNITRLNWTNIFENINYVERILDVNELYKNLDFDTKEAYRNTIKEIADKAGVSEIYVANQLVDLAEEKEYYLGELLIGDKKKELLEKIDYKNSIKDSVISVFKRNKLFAYLFAIYIPTIFLSVLISPNFFVILFIPISEIFVTLINRFLSKVIKPKTLPKLDVISKDVNTFVIVPTLLNSAERVKNMVGNLEVYYLGNKMEGLYFCLLGDASEEQTETVPHDDEVIKTGLSEIEKLNQKYNTNIFHFIYRKRVYNEKQESFLGYERKRGMITEFNDFLINGNKGTFKVNTIKDIPKIKYVITLDADTELVLGSAKRLIGTMEHPLNKPVIQNGIVTKGYGLIQPKIGLSIESSTASTFSKLFAGSGGIDIYTTAESNIYQDVFGEAIFTGKGIYNVEVFREVLQNEIPENKVLSHDLLEGSYLRVGLASDIELIDGFPARVNSYMLRQHRWTRGDWQIIGWLKNKKINGLSKYKITDNLRRSLVDVFLLASFFFGFFWTPLIIIFFPLLLEIEEKLFSFLGKFGFFLINKSFLSSVRVFQNAGRFSKYEKHIRRYNLLFRFRKKGRKNFFPIINGLKGNFYRCFINLILLPYKAVLSLKAIFVTIYRMYFSKKHLLEWVTAADAEKMLGKDLKSYAREMIISPIIGLLLILSTLLYNELSLIKVTLLFVLWWSAPIISYLISKVKSHEKIKIKESERAELLDISQKTWKFFDEYMIVENNFLPPDNYQEGRKKKITTHTSSTNIGLGLLAIISAHDLNFINTKEMIDKLECSIKTIEKLEKWNGHLYNWYNIRSLEPLRPQFISTVDSGNLVGYFYVVKSVLKREHEKDRKSERILNLINVIEQLIENTDFTKLYDYEKDLFSIGYDIKENKLIDSYYDLLASEARQASFIAIAKRDISHKHWFNLGRALTTVNGYKGLVSWAGTMFEYFMPHVIMPSYDYTLLEETYRFSVYSQKEYAKKLEIPWGMSESAFNLQDLNYNYQYKAFGIPWLGLKRGLKEEVVVAPYASILTIGKNYKDVLKNIDKLKKLGAYDKYGFYESIDFTPSRVYGDKKYELVKTYMAHHQGLILLSINNFLNQNILQENFSSNPEIKATLILLQEKVPQNIIYTKEKKEKVNVLKYKDYEDYTEQIIHKPKGNVNITSNDRYTLLINDFGEGYSKLDNVYMTKYTDAYRQSNVIYIKDIIQNEYWSNTLHPTKKEPDEYAVSFSPSESKFYRRDGEIETLTRISVSPDENVELRQVEVRNNKSIPVNIDIMSYAEIILTDQNSDIAHPVYNNLFLCANENEGKIMIEKRFHNGQKYYLTNFAVCENENVKFEIELDKSKIIGRGRSIKNPIIIEENKMFSNNIASVQNTAIAIKSTVTIEPQSSVIINYYIGVSTSSEEIKNIIEKYSKKESEKRLFELAMSRSMVENRFFGLKGQDIVAYNKIMTEIVEGSKTRKQYKDEIDENVKNQRSLWKYGVSGDFPIILIRIKNVNNVYEIKKLINAIEYFLLKNIKVDLVIVDDEKGSERYTSDKILEYIHSKNIAYLLGGRGGIHLIKQGQLEQGDINLLYSCSDIILQMGEMQGR